MDRQSNTRRDCEAVTVMSLSQEMYDDMLLSGDDVIIPSPQNVDDDTRDYETTWLLMLDARYSSFSIVDLVTAGINEDLLIEKYQNEKRFIAPLGQRTIIGDNPL